MTNIMTLERSCLEATELKGGRMLELGNKENLTGTYKEQFVSEGWDHTSVDLNGASGALARDLCVPGSLADLGQFDVVTNFGTTEHVENQWACWENVHNAIKVGGWLVSVTPAPGTWPGHGKFYPYLDWYLKFADVNSYAPRVLGRNRDWNLFVARKEKDAALRFPDSAYMWVEDSKRTGNYGKAA
jgi:hypothetical protein